MILLTDNEVADFFKVSRSTIWRWVKSDPIFPEPVKINGTTPRWVKSDLEEYVAARNGK